jgi:4-amino-4-deoxy-L-arabinose transferase-like glycosyltransferase
MIDPARGRRLILAAACLGFVLRAAFGLLYWVDKPLTHDEREYLALARSLYEGRGFTYDDPQSGTTPQFGRAPAYPVFLVLAGAGTREYSSVPARVKVAQALVGAVSVWIVGLIAFRAAGPAAGAAAGGIAAVYPPLVWISSYALSETLYGALALATAAVLDLAVNASDPAGSRRTSTMALGAGVLAGTAILVRPAMLFFLPLAATWLLWRRKPALAAALIAGTLLVVIPWTVRNARVFGRFVLVASEGGVTFWTGNHPLARGEGDMAANPDIKRAELEFRQAHPGLTAEQLEPLYYREALSYISNHPAWWLTLLARKAFYTVVPAGPSYALHSSRYRITSVVSYVVVLLLALAGAWTLRGRRRPAALFVLAASAVLVCLVFFPQERFRIPVIDPTLIVCAGAACGGRLNSR